MGAQKNASSHITHAVVKEGWGSSHIAYTGAGGKVAACQISALIIPPSNEKAPPPHTKKE